ncbi:hypothetical protein A7X67_17450 [Clostridium sp. W14A]|uniref:YibE/F family protein n=1 Tax=Caproicibacter fermentans TaxID=2576756 RepID=A0A7G8TED1_9FIRM|nr:YibE/F family protein [Caproicibacter fermentans]OCN00196.1 hypothetical protein A7X67_17450 [Clostridium sp. W14A]QNK41972.1 YibE/F family protein [Caproicibacter fermentans]
MKKNIRSILIIREPKKALCLRAAVILVFLIAAAGLIAAFGGFRLLTLSGQGGDSDFVSAKVLEISEDNTSTDPASGGRRVGEQQLKIQILQGPHKGEVMETPNYLSALHNVYAHQGSRIVVRIDTQKSGSYAASVYNYDRSAVLLGITSFFLLLLCVAGGKRGIRSMFGLLFTMSCVFFLLIPMILNAVSPVLAAVVIALLTSPVCFLLLAGWNGKAVSAMLGTAAGVAFSGLFSAAAGAAAGMNGFNMQEAESLLLQTGKSNIQIDGLLVAGIIVSSLGAVMDIAISIASAVSELHAASPKMEARKLFRSGLSIGRDAMGTMANTLILAFTGSSLNMLVLIGSYGIPFSQLISTDLIGVELLQSIAGCIGIILTVPLVALISSRVELLANPGPVLKKDAGRH